MREIKYRIPWINGDGSFSGFTYWGRIDHKSHSSSECFVSPGQWGGRRAKPDEQFTGLKDKNGKEIYEGDVVIDYDEGFLYKVMFYEYHARFMFYDYLNDDYYDNQDIAEHEIIGNIHENPELLGATK